MDWSDNSYNGIDATAMLPDYQAPMVQQAQTVDWATPLLSGINNAVNVWGKVAVTDIQANSRYPMYGYGGVPGQYQTRAGLQISPMLLLLVAGAFVLLKK